MHYVLSTPPTALALIKVAPSSPATCSPSSRPTTVLSGCCRPGSVTGQLAMLVVMVGYTSGGLLLLFSA